MSSVDEICAEVSSIFAKGEWIKNNSGVYEPDSLNKFPLRDVQAVLDESVKRGCLFNLLTCLTGGKVYIATRETLAALGMNMNPLGYVEV